VRTWLVGAAALATLAAGGGVLAVTRAGEALPGTTVEGVAVGGRDRAGTTAAVQELARARTTGVLAVTAAEVRAEVPRDLATVDVEDAVDRALDAGSGPVSLLVGRGGPVRLRTTVDEPALRARLTELAGRVDRAPFAGALTVTGVTVAARPPVAGRALVRLGGEVGVGSQLGGRLESPLLGAQVGQGGFTHSDLPRVRTRRVPPCGQTTVKPGARQASVDAELSARRRLRRRHR